MEEAQPVKQIENTSILKVYYTVEEIGKTKYQDYSKAFRDGFSTCLRLFDIGLRKRTDFNLRVRIEELEKENKELKKVVEKKYDTILQLEQDLGTHSLRSGIPMKAFREVLVETPLGNFTMIVNLDEDTMNNCIINFSVKNTYNTIDACKSKLMLFINNKSNLGFKAYKDKSTAIKLGVTML